MRACVAGLLLLLSVAVTRASDSYVPPTKETFLAGIRAYPLIVAGARRDRIRVGVPQLKSCMPATEVRRLLGDPDFGYVGYKAGGARIPAKLIWNYVLVKKALSETEPGSRVVVWFDPEHRIQGVTVHGAPDIESTVSRRPQTCT